MRLLVVMVMTMMETSSLTGVKIRTPPPPTMGGYDKGLVLRQSVFFLSLFLTILLSQTLPHHFVGSTLLPTLSQPRG